MREIQRGIDVISFKGISLERTPEATEAEGAINNSATKLHFKTMRVFFCFPFQWTLLSKNFLQKYLQILLLKNTLIHSYLVQPCNPYAESCPVKGQQSRMNLASWGIDVSDTTQCSQARPQLVAIVISCLISVELWAVTPGSSYPWRIDKTFVKVKLMKM